jgi:hypothetical protein
MTTLRIAAALAFAVVSLSATSQSAYAWGCIAVSGEGTYGYSYNFDDRDDAAERALNECAERTTTEDVCEITECIEGS